MTVKILFRPRHHRVAMRLDNGAHGMLTLGTLHLKTSKIVWLSDAGRPRVTAALAPIRELILHSRHPPAHEANACEGS